MGKSYELPPLPEGYLYGSVIPADADGPERVEIYLSFPDVSGIEYERIVEVGIADLLMIDDMESMAAQAIILGGRYRI